MIPGTESMKPGMVVQRGGRSVFMELPYYRGFLSVECWRCKSHNTTFEVYKHELATNCLSCARGGRPGEGHPLTEAAIAQAARVRGENHAT